MNTGDFYVAIKRDAYILASSPGVKGLSPFPFGRKAGMREGACHDS